MAKTDYGFFQQLFQYDIRDKKRGVRYYIDNALNKTSKMFKWTGLPDTICPDTMEMMIQCAGYVAFTEIKQPERDPGFYVFTGNFSGEPNRYLMPSNFTIANPTLSKAHVLKIIQPYGDAGTLDIATDGDCVIIKNDTCYQGILPILARYATLLNETDVTIYMTDILTRTQYAISASDESTRASAQKFIDDLTAGRFSVIGDNVFIESLKTLPLNSTNGQRITDLIELEQYLRGSMLNEIGLDANYNMKRERVQSAETQLNRDGLTPLIDDMLDARKTACEIINNNYGLDISVELDGPWVREKIEMIADIANDISEIEQETTETPADAVEDAETEISDIDPDTEQEEKEENKEEENHDTE